MLRQTALTYLLTSIVALPLSVQAKAENNQAPSLKAVVGHYADIAYANYSDALQTAQALQEAINQLTKNPNKETLKQAKQAWFQARIPYQQTEVFRFGNKIVDDWEGQVNAWPLDEGLIDYVDTEHYEYELGNSGASANIIANKQIKVGSKTIDATNITPELLASLNELGGSEANVATGYHAIEFLLWGQDLHGTQAGAGERKVTDFMPGKQCTNQHCDRRVAYLKATSELLVNDLKDMVTQWAPKKSDNYRHELLSDSPEQGLRKMFYGMGSLALGELAGERMKVALEANSTEDEHDCFSDNTHNSHYYNAQGINNIFFGKYQRIDGSTVTGPSVADLVKAKQPKTAQQIEQLFNTTQSAMQTMVDKAEKGMAFDQMIAANNKEGHTIVRNAIQSLVAQTEGIEKAAKVIGIANLNPDNADHSF
ncbi:imelysin family protein [Zooshikella sp. RANM57]|uniref:imelysin family protein n=1 Tax=Zooshikella sp. RANM57 TaxID=3425863 RepID=UPI003D6DED03